MCNNGICHMNRNSRWNFATTAEGIILAKDPLGYGRIPFAWNSPRVTFFYSDTWSSQFLTWQLITVHYNTTDFNTAMYYLTWLLIPHDKNPLYGISLYHLFYRRLKRHINTLLNSYVANINKSANISYSTLLPNGITTTISSYTVNCIVGKF